MLATPLLDHEATVWRRNETKGPKFREVQPGWAIVSGTADTAFGIQVRSERREDPGGGEAVMGDYAGYASDPELDVQEGDVLQLTSGPESPANLEVQRVYRPRKHHTELTLTAWHGSLT